VTLCIAAECEIGDASGNTPAIAMCCDWRAQTGAAESPTLIGSEDVYKMLNWKGATAMLAGVPTKARELAAECRVPTEQFFQKAVDPMNFDLIVNELLEDLRTAVRKRKREIIRHFVETKLGISVNEFQKLPSDNYLDTWSEYKGLSLGADILICCVTHEPVIVRVDRWGEVHWENNYFAIGEGSEVARAFLCLQPWYGSEAHGKRGHFNITKVPLLECLYRIYEAKMAANIAHPSSVGEATGFEVLTSATRANISQGCSTALTQCFLRKHAVPDLSSAVPNGVILGVISAF